jgi:magnesium transporter
VDVERALVSEFLSSHPDDAARVLDQMPLEQAVAVLSEAPPAAGARGLSGMGADQAARCLETLPAAQGCALLEALPAGTAAMLLRRLTPDSRQALLRGVAGVTRQRLELLLRYPEQTAGGIMDPLTATVPDDIPVEQARRRLREFPAHLYYYVYVVGRDQALRGVVGLRELLVAAGDELVRAVMKTDVMSLADRAPLAAVLVHPGWRDFHALPVVSEDGMFVGMIRYKTVRRLVEESDAGQGPAGMDTLFALGELYWTGLVELFGGMSAGTRGPRRP